MPVPLADRKPSERLRLLQIAIWQRRLNWMVAVALVWLFIAAVIAFYARPLLGGRNFWHVVWWPLYLPVWIAVVVTYIRLMRSLGIHVLWIALLVVSMTATLVTIFIPMIILGAAGDRATRALVDAGLRVGFMGATPAQRRQLFDGVCHACGYDLRGLPEARCPECGALSRSPA